MKRIGFLLVAVAETVGIIGLLAPASGHADEATPVFVSQVPPGYRDWKLISVAHEEGQLNDIRAILGNDTAIGVIVKTSFLFRKGRSSPASPGNIFRRKKITRSSAAPNLRFPGRPRSGIASSW